MAASLSTDASAFDSVYWDRVVEGWEPSLAHRLWRAHSDAVNVDLLRRWLPIGPGSVLKTDLFDEAVGQGLYPELATRFGAVTGIDVSASAVRAASQRYPRLDARVANVLALPFADETFDAVVSNSTLDHFESRVELRASVIELTRVTRRGGKLLITLDNRMNPIVAVRTSPLFGTLRRLGVVPYFVGTTCGPRGLARLLKDAGFDLVEMTSIMHWPPQIAAHWTARRRGGSTADVDAHLRRVLRAEVMGQWPTRHLTGHFVCAVAVRR